MATRGEVGLFRWGIIGSGFVARKFVLGLRQSEDGRPTLVYSRNTDNARRFAQDFGIGEVARDLEEAARSSSVDAFYLATPPTAHREQALACLSQGKPVLSRSRSRRRKPRQKRSSAPQSSMASSAWRGCGRASCH
jgi:saccharopine dehydrogenase-like NADP-dependent oxidoreductase